MNGLRALCVFLIEMTLAGDFAVGQGMRNNFVKKVGTKR